MNQINEYLLLAVSVVMMLAYSVARNKFSKTCVKTMTDYHAFNLLSSALSTAVLIGLSGGIRIPSLFTLLTGIIFGLITVFSSIVILQALTIGPISYTTVMITSSMIIPALSGRLFWNEPIYPGQYIGMVLIIISVVFSINKSDNSKSSSVKWLMLSLAAFLLCGLTGIMQKLHQSSSYRSELNEFLIIAFSVSTIVSLGMYLWYSQKKKIPKSGSYKVTSPIFRMGVISGVFIALSNQINLYLSGAMDSAIFFPVVNGGGLVLTAIVAIAFLKEKLSRRQWLGLSIGILAILLLCNVI